MKRILFLVLYLSLATAVHAQTFTISELFGFSCPNSLCPDGSHGTCPQPSSEAGCMRNIGERNLGVTRAGGAPHCNENINLSKWDRMPISSVYIQMGYFMSRS
jgi:hypothetical protein